jgi:hypothetical protein
MNVDTFGLILIFISGCYIYFWPSRIAFRKDNPYKQIIILINLFFGWTFLVWFILLIYVYFPKEKTLLDPILDPSGTLSAKKIGKRISDFKRASK